LEQRTVRLKLFLKILFGTFLLFLICVSFKRYHYFPLDGDLPAIILPTPSYAAVMKDPFGLNVVLHDSVYSATNRFFAHLSLMAYFKNVPLWLQYFFTPIKSIYVASGVAKTLIHFFLIYLIAIYATGKKKIWDSDVLLAAAIATPFFQTYGYYEWMAVIDSSISYTFFYALAISWVFLFFLPFFNAALGRNDFDFSRLKMVLLIILIAIISFNGPLNAPVMLLVCSTVLFYYSIKNYIRIKKLPFLKRCVASIKNIPSSMFVLFATAIVIGLYSYFIGKNNSENSWQVIPIPERYSRLWQGLLYRYTYKLGQPLLIVATIINSFLIWKLKPDRQATKALNLLKWFVILSVVYLLLLPLGGYRPYRENIARWDTILPVTLGFILFYSYTTFYIIKHVEKKYIKIIYYGAVIIISTIYFNADWGVRKYNACERNALQKIAESNERIVFIDNDCSIIEWHKTTIPADSKTRSDLLLYWNVIKEQKLFYQK